MRACSVFEFCSRYGGGITSRFFLIRSLSIIKKSAQGFVVVHHFRDHPVCIVDSLTKGLQKMNDHSGVMTYALKQRRAGQGNKPALTNGHSGGCAGMLVDEGHLSEEITFFEQCKHGLVRILETADLNGAGLNDEHGVAGLTLIEDDLAFTVSDTEKFPARAHLYAVRAPGYNTPLPPISV